MDRLFLDGNILFSAAYRSGSGLSRLWERNDVQLIASLHALKEAERNLCHQEQRKRLKRLGRSLEIIATRQADHPLAAETGLSDKHRAVLREAAGARATHLVTGDFHHFGTYYGKKIAGVLLVPPAAYLSGISRKGPPGAG